MRIVYKGTRSGKTRVAIITYGDNEENKAYEIAIKFRNITSYKVDTGVSGMLIIDVDDMSDYNNLKVWYKEFKKSNNTNDNKTTTDNDTKDTESDTNKDTNDTNKDTNTTDSANNEESNNKTPAELKADINKKYGVNSDSILNATEKQIVHKRDNEVYATTTKIIICDICDNDEVCTITPYENEKELTTPIPKMKCLTNVIDYVKRLYDMNVVTRETYFIIFRDGKRNVVLTNINTHFIVNYYKVSDDMVHLEKIAVDEYGYYSKYTRRPSKIRQYDTLELYKNNIYITISECNDNVNAVRNFWCNITYKDVNHIGQYTYKELLHLIDNIRYNTQEYSDKYFD